MKFESALNVIKSIQIQQHLQVFYRVLQGGLSPPLRGGGVDGKNAPHIPFFLYPCKVFCLLRACKSLYLLHGIKFLCAQTNAQFLSEIFLGLARLGLLVIKRVSIDNVVYDSILICT